MHTGGSQFKVDGFTHYQRNKDYYINRNKRSRELRREYIINIKKQGQCVDCGNKDYRVLEFDHVGDNVKLANISNLVSRGWSLKRIDLEIAKCELRCANCHRIITFQRLKF